MSLGSISICTVESRSIPIQNFPLRGIPTLEFISVSTLTFQRIDLREGSARTLKDETMYLTYYKRWVRYTGCSATGVTKFKGRFLNPK